MSGYVKLHRKIIEHPVFAHDGMFRLWSYCLMRANWKDVTTVVPGTLTPIVVGRGQFITGRDKLHVQLYGDTPSKVGIPVSRTLWRWMESLDELDCIKLKTLSNRCTLVTVCNYETYQGDGDDVCPADVQPVSSTCPAGSTAGVQPVSTNKEDKEVKKERKRKSPPVGLAECLKTCEQVHIEISPVWHQWFTYKHERGESFTEAGLKAAVTHLGNKISAHGVQPVAEAILKAMASGWQGFEYGNTFKNVKPVPASLDNRPIIKKFPPHRIGIDQ